MRSLTITAILLAAAASAASAASEPEQETASFERLIDEIRRSLPDTWELDVSPWARWHGGEGPLLALRTRCAVPVENIAPGAAAAGDEPALTDAVQIRLWLMPYLSPEEHRQLRERNERLIQRRIEAERRLQGVNWGHKGPPPVPPGAYLPADEGQRRLVRGYALLWLNTQPQVLPTHRFERLSVSLLPETVHFPREEHDRRDYTQALSAVQRLLTSYEEPERRLP